MSPRGNAASIRSSLRRRNLIAPDQMPYNTKFVFTYDSGEFERNMDDALELSEWTELRRAAQGREEARQAARHRDRERDRDFGGAGACADAGKRRDQVRRDRRRHRVDGHAFARPGARDHVRADRRRFPRSRNRRRAGALRRHRRDRIRHRHLRQPLGHHRIELAAHFRRPADRARQDASPPCISRRMPATSCSRPGNSRLPAPTGASASRTWRSCPTRCAIRASAGSSAFRKRPSPRRRLPRFPNGCHVCEVEIDPDTGICQISELCRGRRCRARRQSDAGQGPGAWRGGAGRRADPVREHRLRRGRSAAVRLVHGLRDAARRAFSALRLQGERGADADEPAWREGRGRGGDGRARWRR